MGRREGSRYRDRNPRDREANIRDRDEAISPWGGPFPRGWARICSTLPFVGVWAPYSTRSVRVVSLETAMHDGQTAPRNSYVPFVRRSIGNNVPYLQSRYPPRDSRLLKAVRLSRGRRFGRRSARTRCVRRRLIAIPAAERLSPRLPTGTATMPLDSFFARLHPRTSSKRSVRRHPGRLRRLGGSSLGAGFQELENRRLLTATLAMDINPGPPSSNPAQVASLSGNLLFAANDGVHGTQLWRSDGTATVLLDEINTTTSFNGVTVVQNDSNPTDLTTSGGFVYFAANDGIHGAQLWKTDGTTVNTTMVTNINSGGG